MPLLIPPLVLCTDNGAMIGAAAHLKYKRGEFTPLDMKAEPGLIAGRMVGTEARFKFRIDRRFNGAYNKQQHFTIVAAALDKLACRYTS